MTEVVRSRHGNECTTMQRVDVPAAQWSLSMVTALAIFESRKDGRHVPESPLLEHQHEWRGSVQRVVMYVVLILRKKSVVSSVDLSQFLQKLVHVIRVFHVARSRCFQTHFHTHFQAHVRSPTLPRNHPSFHWTALSDALPYSVMETVTNRSLVAWFDDQVQPPMREGKAFDLIFCVAIQSPSHNSRCCCVGLLHVLTCLPKVSPRH